MAIERAIRYVRPDELHQTFNFPYLQTPLEPVALRQVIDDSLSAYASVGAPATWVLSNHDVVRHASRYGYPADAQPRMGVGADDPQPDAALGLRRARAAILLMLALPGSAYLYQGEELGLPEHTTMPDDARQDPNWERSGHTERGRDGCRVPLPGWPGSTVSASPTACRGCPNRTASTRTPATGRRRSPARPCACTWGRSRSGGRCRWPPVSSAG